MKAKLIIILSFLFLLTGCYNYSELNEMSIVSGISIDKDDNLYSVSFLITNAQKPDTSSQDNSADMTVLSGKGKTVTEAINDIDLKNPKKYYLGHLSSLIVSKDVAKNMKNIMDFFIRNPQSLKRFYLVISDGNAEDTLKIISPQEILPSENIISNLKEINEEQAIIKDQIYSMFLIDILSEGKDPTLPVVEVKGNVKDADDSKDLEKVKVKTNVEIKSLALFKDYKIVKIANKKESRGINVVNNKVNNLYLSINCDNGNSIATLNNIKSKISYKIKDNKPVFTISTKGDINLRETTCDYNLNNDNTINKIKKEYEKELKKTIEAGVKLAQKEEVDLFGFGNMLYKKNYDYWKKNKNSWRHLFSEIEVNINADLSLSSVGAAKDTIGGLKNND